MSEDLEGEQDFHNLKAPNPAFPNNIEHIKAGLNLAPAK